VILRRSLSTHLIAAWALTLSAGCATPTEQGYAFARAHGFESAVVTGTRFRHTVWRKAGLPSDDVLHVYIEGDGTPHPLPDRVAIDPTPRQPLMLHLMALDPHRSIYVGRPCYWGLYADRGCSPYFWTLGRYSAAVVDSLVAVINLEKRTAPGIPIVLYGHSGGATLELLAVERGLKTEGVVTIAGNLDPDAWSALHHYTPLAGSLNPIRLPLPQPEPPIRHYVGDHDQMTPAAFVLDAATHIGGDVIVIPGFEHQCCWERIWLEVVEFPRLR
jgi:pimeloyl-ACP methyl ester carboxylesterase